MRILLAPDKFKGTFTAAEVCTLLEQGIREVLPDAQVRSLPVADGGEGTLDAVLAAGYTPVRMTVTDAAGAPHQTHYARRGPVALVELATTTLRGAPGRYSSEGSPVWTYTSRGVGEAIAAALDAGADQILLGIGGSLSNDGGAGMLAALGARILDADDHPVPDGARGLQAAATVDLAGLRVPPSLEILCDVDNPLTGPHGAAAVYGPQKGATGADVPELDAALAHWADLVEQALGGRSFREEPGAGAAGGVGFAGLSALGGTLRSGASAVLDLVGFPDALSDAELVVTGEGSMDEQTLHGKAPAVVAAAAQATGIPVLAVCGVNQLAGEVLRDNGFAASFALADGDLASDSPEAVVAAGRWIGRQAASLSAAG